MNIALLHDGLLVSGGAERLVIALCEAYPSAPLFTSVWHPEATFPFFKKQHQPHTFFGANLAKGERSFKLLYPLWWFGFRTINLKGYDKVLSSSSYLAKYARVPAGVPHISYLHNPFRYLWDRTSYQHDSLPMRGTSLKIADSLLPYLRRIDIRYTRQLDHILTNSHHMAKKIHDIYNRTAEVVYPPVNVVDFPFSTKREDFYLFVGRLLSYKRADLAIQACQNLGRKLLVVGIGPEEVSLKQNESENIQFLGRVSDEQLKNLYARAHAVIFPGNEDFGLIPLEAQATGCPVIAFGAGGALESIIDAETGLFFHEQSVDSLMDTMLRAENIRFDSTIIRNNALRFDLPIFTQKIHTILARY